MIRRGRHRVAPALVSVGRRYWADQRAVAAVEVALTLPFFMIFLAVIMEVGLFYYATAGVEQGVFNYSRRLTAMTKTERQKVIRAGLAKDVRAFTNRYLVKKLIFEVGPATGETDFKRELTKNRVIDFATDKSKPIYLRVVAHRRGFTRDSLSYVWDVISPSYSEGLFAPIDILVVLPWPLEDDSP